MQLARFPRRRYTPGPTPIERLDQLSGHLDGPEIWIKRDDLLGLAGGGNKTRKLEFLVADALSRGADALITVGAVQSNHCRLTLAAAAKEGLKCRLVLEQRVPGSYDPKASGNNFLFDLLGVEDVTVVDAGADLDAAMQAVADELSAEGRRGYIIPGGGSNALGALGYVACAGELLAQGFDTALTFDHLVCASGSAGTHAGLLVGLHAASARLPVTGINVRRPRAEQEGNVHALGEKTAALLGVEPPPRASVTCLDDWVGPGYSLPTPEMVEAVRLLARLEGVLLDPVYTGKAMAGLIGLVRRGHFKRGERVLFLHTGGSPALYAYQPVLASPVTPPRRTAGVLGGMGPAATLDFMARVQALRAGGRDQDHVRLIVDLNPAVPDRNAAVTGTGPSPAPALAEMARGLERAGADFLVMPCNAAHAFADAIRAATSLPFLDMIEAVADAAVAAGARRPGLLAASACLDSGLYQRALTARGVEPIVADGDLRNRLMAAIYAVKSADLDAARSGFRAVAEALAAAGADVLIAACTEVPLVLEDGDAPLPLINSTQVLAERTVEWACASAPPPP